MRLLDDTLKSPNGKWSRKSISWLVGMILFVTEVLFHLITGRNIQPEVIYTTTVLMIGMGAMTVYDKLKRPQKKAIENGNN